MGLLTDLTGGHTPVAFGQSPTADTTNKKFGSSAAYFNGSAGVQVPSHSDFALGNINGTATIHGWFRTAAGSVYLYNDSKTYPTYIRLLSAGTLSVQWGFSGRLFNWGWGAGPDFRDNAWHHVAMTIVDTGNVWINFYVDGWLRRRFYDDYSNNDPAQGILYLGSHSGGTERLTGQLDSWEIVNGTALWSGGTENTDVFDHNALTQPTVTSNDVLILNFNETYYKVSGTVSHDSVIRVYDGSWSFIKSQAVSAGAYEVNELQTQNDLKVVCIRNSSSEILAHNLVDGIEY